MSAWTQKRGAMERYNATAAGYDELYGEEQKRKFQIALEYADAKGKAVLDVGCGSGLFFSHVAGQARLVVGVDVSRGLLKKAKLHSRGFGDVEVVLADADHLPFRAEFFDDVFVFTVLQNMPRPGETLSEFMRVSLVGSPVVVTGLKKAFELTKFMDIIEASGMKLAAFVDEDAINCYIAVLTA